MESSGLHAEPGQQPLSFGRARFRAGGKTDPEFAPAPGKIPGVIAQAKANLQHPPRIHTETAIEQTQGAINLVRTELAPLLDQAPQMKKELAPLQDKTAAALEDYKKWLQNDLLPAPMATSVSARRSTGRNCASPWRRICRWKKS